MYENMLSDAKNKELYPVTIVQDRYAGSYSGGAWLAFNMDFYDVPVDIEAGDPECMIFWHNHDNLVMPVGKGHTPQGAYDDLLVKVAKYAQHRLDNLNSLNS